MAYVEMTSPVASASNLNAVALVSPMDEPDPGDPGEFVPADSISLLKYSSMNTQFIAGRLGPKVQV